MNLRICYLAVCVFTIIFLGTIKATGSQTAKDTRTLSEHFAAARETALSSLVGRFVVVGTGPDNRQTYRGSVIVTRRANSLYIQELINGKTRTGVGRIEFEPETPTLEVVFEGAGVRAGYETWAFGATRQPRASGWVDLTNGDYQDRQRLGMEVWYNNQSPPGPTFVQAELNSALKDQPETDPDLLQIEIGDYRIIGEDTGTGRAYTGKVRVRFAGKQLTIKGSIDGKAVRGEFMRLAHFHRDLIRYRVGAQSMLSFVDGYSVGDNYPRFCGYFYPQSDPDHAITNTPPRLETWFFDWR
jgi:hypothetical protein